MTNENLWSSATPSGQTMAARMVTVHRRSDAFHPYGLVNNSRIKNQPGPGPLQRKGLVRLPTLELQRLHLNINTTAVNDVNKNVNVKDNIVFSANLGGHQQHHLQQQLTPHAQSSHTPVQQQLHMLPKPNHHYHHIHQLRQPYPQVQFQPQQHQQHSQNDAQIPHQQQSSFPPKQIKSQNDTPVLPPCRVCGDKSTGIHYGAMTCEACKGFFRRSLSRKNEFNCLTGTQSCQINCGGKTPCACCRLAKCVAIGMSREGIKRGRYTLSQRTSHIKEVKALQESGCHANKLLQKSPGGCLLTLPKSVEATTLEGNVNRHNYHLLSKAIHSAYLVHCQYPPEIEQNLEEIQHIYLNKKSHDNISEYSINNEDLFTDIHENGWLVKDKLKMLHKRIQFIEDAVKKLACFAKNIPGFKKLPTDDQMTLVKSVQFYWWFLSVYPGMSSSRQLYTTPLRDTVSRDEIAEFMTEKFADTVFHLAGIFNALKLSEEEKALVLGLSVVSTDGCPEMEDQSTIDHIHEGFAQTLYYLTKDKHPDQPTRFGRIVAALTELRSAEAPHVEAAHITRGRIERMKVEVPPLLLELWAALPRKQ